LKRGKIKLRTFGCEVFIKMICKIYLFRHGQTNYNQEKKFTGWKESRLTSLGKKQTRDLAKKLKNKRIDAAFHTRQSRTKATLKEVLKYHPECHIIIKDDRMIERSYGKLEGHSHNEFLIRKGTEDYETLVHWHNIDHLHGKEREDFIKQVGEAELKVMRRSYEVRPPKGESIKDVEKRVLSFIKHLLIFMKRKKVNVAIAASGNSMRPFRRYFEKASVEEMMSWEMPYDKYFEYSVKV
jgi:2,3-bisphosphoglycerate-dependent phosphoglycerate mutase